MSPRVLRYSRVGNCNALRRCLYNKFFYKLYTRSVALLWTASSDFICPTRCGLQIGAQSCNCLSFRCDNTSWFLSPFCLELQTAGDSLPFLALYSAKNCEFRKADSVSWQAADFKFYLVILLSHCPAICPRILQEQPRTALALPENNRKAARLIR